VSIDRDERHDRATSFAAVADAYERARPGYPDEAVRWLAGEVPCDVVDLGAGTGKLTRLLVALGHRVTAVEPLPEMIEQLRAAVPGVAVARGEAEAMPLPARSADTVTVAQAFHWFDRGPALREIARVLRPGGVLGLVWNTRDEREPWVAQLTEKAIGRDTIERSEVAAPHGESGLFGEMERHSFPYAQQLDREGLIDLVLSRSYCAVMTVAERAPLLRRVERLFDEHGVNGVVELPYVTECFRSVRL